MNCYLLKGLEGIRIPDIQNYNQAIPYLAFEQNQSYKIPERNVCILNAPFDYGVVLLNPFPLFSTEAKKALDLFLWDYPYKEFIFLDQKSKTNKRYFLPFFPRISGETEKTESKKEITVHLESPWPEDIPVIYLQTKKQILMLVRLDLLESLMRKGLCGIEVIPLKI